MGDTDKSTSKENVNFFNRREVANVLLLLTIAMALVVTNTKMDTYQNGLIEIFNVTFSIVFLIVFIDLINKILLEKIFTYLIQKIFKKTINSKINNNIILCIMLSIWFFINLKEPNFNSISYTLLFIISILCIKSLLYQLFLFRVNLDKREKDENLKKSYATQMSNIIFLILFPLLCFPVVSVSY
jgi:hypothetical protein